MRGSVKKDGGSWGFVLDAGTDTVSGKRRQVRRRGFTTRKAAEAAMAEVLSDVNRGRFVAPVKGTLGQYLEETWLLGRHDLRRSTVVGYEKAVRRIKAILGHVPLAALDVATVEAFYGRLLTSGGRNGVPVSAKTVANTAGVLSVALGDAVRLKLLPHNVASDARLPRREFREMTAWSEEEAAAFLGAVASERLAPLWRLLLTTG